MRSEKRLYSYLYVKGSYTLSVHSTLAFNHGTTAQVTAPYFASFLAAEISGVFGDE